MKNKNLKTKSILTLALASFLLMGAKISDNTLKLGDNTPATSKEVQMGNGRLKWDGSTSKMVFSNDTGGSFKDIGSGGSGGTGINLLDNADFESGSPPTSWTASGGTFVRTTTAANVAFGLAAGAWDSSAASQTLISTAKPIPVGMFGESGVASCKFKTATGVATHKIQAFDGTNVLAEAPIISSTTSYPRSTINFIYPSTGNIQLRIISVNANEPEIFIDECFLGLAEGFNLANLSQAQFVGSITYAPALNCEWTTGDTGDVYTVFGADVDCSTPVVAGSASAPGTKIPAIVFSSLPPGEYVVISSGLFLPQAAAVTADLFYELNDGTTGGDTSAYVAGNATFGSTSANVITSRFKYTSAQSNVTFQMRARSTSNSNDPTIINNAIGKTTFSIFVYRYPLSTEQAFRMDQVNQFGQAKWTGVANCAWNTTSGAFGDFATDADCADPAVKGIAALPTSTKTPGFKASGLLPGRYKVFANGVFQSASGDNCIYRIFDGTNVIANVNPSSQILGHMEGVVEYTGVQGALDFRIQARRLAGAGAGCTLFNDNADYPLQMGIVPIDRVLPMPILANGITSSSAGLDRSERVRAACGSATITSQSGNWISSNSTNGTGDCTLNFSAAFSDTPTCACTVEDATGDRICSIHTVSSSLVRLLVRNPSLTAVNAGVSVQCQGPK